MRASLYRCLPNVCLILLTLYLAACQASPVQTPSPTMMLSSTATPRPTSSPAPSISPTSTSTPTPISPICSPLSNHPLAQLPSLVSWPFAPASPDRHYGLDLGHWALGDEESSLYDPVQAVMDGRVSGIVLDRPPSGYMILLETPYAQLPPALIEAAAIPPGQSVYHQYAHLAEPPLFEVDQSVVCGQFLDRVGLTGWTVAPHLHLETRYGPPGFTFEAMAYYTGDATPAEIAAYETWFLSSQYQAFDPMILLSIPTPDP
jgi:hypothetical protein